MNEIFIYPLYVTLGLIGGSGHYLKKRYIDDTTRDSFFHYLTVDLTSTKKASLAILTAAISLALTHTGSISGQDVLSILTAGYVADSGFNKDSGG